MKREIVFTDGFQGTLYLENGTVPIGKVPGGAAPYELLYGALASCLYATFMGILIKKKISITECRIEVDGEKREEIPTTLEWCHLTVTIKGAEKEEPIKKSFDLACKYCSIYTTISQVAKMSWEMKFE